MTEQEKYIRDQRKWIKLNKLKVGDRFKVIAKAETYQSGWMNSWVLDMKVGFVGSCVREPNEWGVPLSDHLSYPFFCLVKINE